MSQIIQLGLKFVNAFLIKGSRLALVDTGNPQDISALAAAISKAGADIRDLALIIHTHAHVDHCGGSAHLQKATKALVAIHQGDALALSEGRSTPIVPVDRFGRLAMMFMNESSMRVRYQPVTPDIVIGDDLDLHPLGIDGRAIATPGHTPGSISILLDSGQAIVGDLIGGGWLLGLLHAKRPRHHHWHSDMRTVKASIAKVLDTAPKRWFVGHGGPLDGQAVMRHFGTRLQTSPNRS